MTVLRVAYDVSLISHDDLYLFNEGTHSRLYEKLGSHPTRHEDTDGIYFAVWAPNAASVSVVGDFNDWNGNRHPLRPRADSGIWEGFIPGLERMATYKYHLVSHEMGYRVDKSDPFAFLHETPPATASKVWSLDYAWSDSQWMIDRRYRNSLDAPMAIYEVHLGSWMRRLAEDNRPLTYRELAKQLVDYVEQMEFTHVEFLPVMEHPFYGSWGYQATGYFAPTSRYGTPQDFMYLIDRLHQCGVGVILDWVPSHFPNDAHGLGFFDGTHLYEHADPRQGIHPDWNSYVFNYSRHEVRSFILSSALFWLDVYHADALRVDAVASMLYLDYSREPDQWIPNQYGGRENLEAISLLRRLNEEAYRQHPDIQTVAEESSAWPSVSKPNYVGGLGFGLKWDMGWMNDTLSYMRHDPVHRKYHHNQLTFRSVYAFNENFILPLSHDEVVHGKGSLLDQMRGDTWQKFANLRLLLGYMYAQPGKKLLFMGGEFGQWDEWDHDRGLDWYLLEHASHSGMQRWVKDLNATYRAQPALHGLDCDPAGFGWIDANDSEQSVISFLRLGRNSGECVAVVCNFTPVVRDGYDIGVPIGGVWDEILNSDASEYGGSGQGNWGQVQASDLPWHGRKQSLHLRLPPLGVVFLKPRSSGPPTQT